MDIKKSILMGSAVCAMALCGACSDDSSSGASDDVVESSDGSVTGNSSGEGGTAPGSSSATAQSSSSLDASVTYMAITEIMYNAPDASELEWVELAITSGPDLKSMKALNLHLDGAVTYYFPDEGLTKGEYVVVTNNPELFRTEYPEFSGRLFGPWEKDAATGLVAKLSNEGDVIDIKLMGEGDVSASFSNEPPWPSLANGKGRTLVYKGGNAAQANSWGASKILKGNPGVGNDEWLETSNVRLNEITPSGTGKDAWVELYNAGSDDVDVTGWTFESKLRKETLTIASGVVPAKGYLVLDAKTGFDKELVVSPIGGSYYLYGNTDGDESSLLLPSSELSSGVVDLSDGSTAQGALKEATKGEANAPLYFGSVVINEIHYHPNEQDPNQVEFLELKNVSAENISMYVALTGASKGWKVEGINFEFASTDVLPAGGLAVLFPDSLKAALGADKLRARYSIADDVLIAFYQGKLSNRGEMIAVKKPYYYQEDFTNPSASQFYYDWSDATLYSDNWNGAGIDYKRADGYGYSLQRKDYTTMGYDASAWIVGEPTPGK